MSHWWRAEDSSIDHPKLLKLTDAMFRAWYTLNCIASANDGVLPPTDDIAVRLRMKPAKVAEWITKLVTSGLYDNDDGVFRPHNWNKRQYKSDKTDPTAPDRMKRYRENKKRNSETVVTERNDRNAAVTVIRPEAEAETDTEQSRADAPAAVDEDLRKRAAALSTSVSLQFSTRGYPVPTLDRCEHWLRTGYAAGTVLKAVENVLKRGKPIATLDYFDGAIRDAHGKDPVPALQVVSSKVVVIEGTLEHTCWNQYRREKGMRPLFVCNQVLPGSEAIVMGSLCDTLFPPGYDEATGEKLPPKSDEAAA